jgi:transaldolase/glucose-6-phosphate isomerase
MTTTTTASTLGSAHGANPLKALLAYGQSAWMDYIRRDLLTNGELQRMIHDDGLRGMTSNPAIFEKAIATSQDYADILTSPDAKKMDAKGIYERIAIRDVQAACDIFKPVYEESKTRDGFGKK